jgi:hypothetical protein
MNRGVSVKDSVKPAEESDAGHHEPTFLGRELLEAVFGPGATPDTVPSDRAVTPPPLPDDIAISSRRSWE